MKKQFAKIENVKELLQAIYHLESQETNSITAFLDEVALMQAQIQRKAMKKTRFFL